jgi:hypothetical protein
MTPLLFLGLAVAAPAPADEAFFEAKVQPLLVAHCESCHSAAIGKTKGGLTLDTRAGWAAGGDSGPAVRPGDPDGSQLVTAVRYTDEGMRMPPKGKLAAGDIAVLEKWVAMGAPDPRVGPASSAKAGIDLEAGKRFWSFRPVADPRPPAVTDAAWPATDADRFLLAAMEAKGVRPVGDADRLTLLRRVSHDLTGLPPSDDDIRTFLADESADAYGRAVDRLLASPHFGEHRGRHWLDVTRYADSNGSSFNPPFREAWKYRNWVIAAVKGSTLREAAGTTGPDGRFELKAIGAGGGAAVGKNRVRISLLTPPKKGEPQDGLVDRVPDKYKAGDGLQFDVPAGGTADADFDLTSDPKAGKG